MLSWFLRQFSRVSGDPEELDFLPVTGAEFPQHAEKLKAAAERHGKAFKCAPDGVLRERIAAKTGEHEIVRPKATVTVIHEKRKGNLSPKVS